MEGWIKLHRKISDNGFWKCEPFTRGQAWVDLLLLASHQDTFFYVRGIKINLKVGQLAWGEVKLSERWHWSRTKLRKFLNELEKEQQIRQQKDNVIQVITIVNYKEYQQKEQQIRQQKDSRSTTEVQQKNIYKNDKKVKELKEFKENVFSFASKYPRELIEEFIIYWIEPNQAQTKFKWQMEKTWHTGGRLSTWARRSKHKNVNNEIDIENLWTDEKDNSE